MWIYIWIYDYIVDYFCYIGFSHECGWKQLDIIYWLHLCLTFLSFIRSLELLRSYKIKQAATYHWVLSRLLCWLIQKTQELDGLELSNGDLVMSAMMMRRWLIICNGDLVTFSIYKDYKEIRNKENLFQIKLTSKMTNGCVLSELSPPSLSTWIMMKQWLISFLMYSHSVLALKHTPKIMHLNVISRSGTWPILINSKIALIFIWGSSLDFSQCHKMSWILTYCTLSSWISSLLWEGRYERKLYFLVDICASHLYMCIFMTSPYVLVGEESEEE